MTYINDMISQATRLALNSSVNYNPGMPITVDFRPLTLDPKYGNKTAFLTPGVNIYHERPTPRTFGSLFRHSIDCRVKASILKGGKGCHSDYTGLLILTFYSNDPDAWFSLFRGRDHAIHYTDLLSYITGLSSKHTTAFVNGASAMFGGDDTPQHHEKILRSLLPF